MQHAPDASQLDGLINDRRRALAAGGRAGTLLTGAQGLTAPAQTAPKTLLGM